MSKDCYCGKCGKECHPVSHVIPYIDEAPFMKRFENIELTSDCCDSDYLYADEEQTIDYEFD